MRYRPLGSTGLEVSEIGFGAWGIGGNAKGAVAYGATLDADSVRAVRRACDRGVNFFDTADFYGFGHSERVLGAALGAMRSDVLIATKAGLVDASGAQDFSPRHLRQSLEASLKRLGTDYVDLFQLHSPPAELLSRRGEALDALDALRREGKARAYGISVRSPDEGLAAAELGFPCVQVNFNLVDQRALENGLLDKCASAGIGLIVRTPLCFGFLTGQYSAATRFEKDDHRNRWSAEQKNRWADAMGLFASSMRKRTGDTPAQFALRFCLSFKGVSTVIPGMLTEEHVMENAGASDLGPLTDEDCAAIVRIYGENSFFVEGKSPVS